MYNVFKSQRTSLDFLKVSSLNEELQKRGKQFALANNEVITSLRVFDYCN